MGSVRRMIDRAYSSERGLDTGTDPRAPTSAVLAFVWRKGWQRVRAVLRGYPNSYFAARVRVRSRLRLALGAGTSIGSGVVLDALSLEGIVLGDRVTIDEGAVLRGSGVIRNLGTGIRVGDRTSIGAGNFIHGGGGVTIGSDCLLGPRVTVLSENHVFADPVVPIREQGETRKPVVIGDDVWLGAGATVLAGVTIADHVVVAAGAVVTSSIDAPGVYGGIPARRIADRGSN